MLLFYVMVNWIHLKRISHFYLHTHRVRENNLHALRNRHEQCKMSQFSLSMRNQIKMPILLIHTHLHTHIYTLLMAYSTLFSHCCHAVLTWLPASSTSTSSSSSSTSYEASQQLLHCTSCLPPSQYTYIWVYSSCPTQLKLPFFYLYGTYIHSYSIFLLFVYPHPVCVP